MSGHGYARAVYNFVSEHKEDVSLHAGDIVLVLEEVDENWLKGKNHNKVGYFPRTYVKSMQLPQVYDGQRVFLATRPFAGEESGDLSFDDGDILVGLEPVDNHDHWWHASLSGHTGIIPLTHVVEMHSSDDGHLCNLWSAAPSTSESSKSNMNSGVVGSTVIAHTDLTAQLDYELTFSCGDEIYVLEDLGDGFAIGQCNGAVGQFPLCFCTPMDPQAASQLPSPEMPQSINAASHPGSPSWKKSHSRPTSYGSYTLANTWSQDCSVKPYCSTLYEFRGRVGELSFGAGEIVHLISHLDDDWCFGELDGNCGAFPTSYVDIIVDCDAARGDQLQPELKTETADAVFMVTQTSSSSTSQTVDHGINSGELYGRLICDFVAVNVNELDASEGETVTVLQRIDQDWLEVRHDNGRVGLCPTSFIELFGAEPEPIVTPDIPTSAVVKPKPPVKPKLAITSKTPVRSSASADQNKKSPAVVSPPALTMQTVTTQPSVSNVFSSPTMSPDNTFLPSMSYVLSSPIDNNAFLPNVTNVFSLPLTETPKSAPVATMVKQPLSPGPSLDELIQAQVTSAKSVTSTTAVSGRHDKPISQKTTPNHSTLNGMADVVGQSNWYGFSDTEHVHPVAVTRKAPPPPRPAPSRHPGNLAAASSLPANASKTCPDVAYDESRKPNTNLIEFSPDHNTASDVISAQPSVSKEQLAEKHRETREKDRKSTRLNSSH